MIYPIIHIYIDAACTKIDLNDLNSEMFIVYTIIISNLINLLLRYKEKIEELQNFSKEILGEPDELFKIRVEKEELFLYYIKENTKLQRKYQIIQKCQKTMLQNILKNLKAYMR